jgi:hypothetical protein
MHHALLDVHTAVLTSLVYCAWSAHTVYGVCPGRTLDAPREACRDTVESHP